MVGCSPVIPFVTSTRENCLGSECPKFRQCHVNAARRDALGRLRNISFTVTELG